MPSTLYAGTQGGVFKSTNAGSTWSPFDNGLMGSRIWGLAIDPHEPHTLHAGTGGNGVFTIQQVDAPPTPTPTATQRPTNTPTATPVGGGGGDGCTVTPRHVEEGHAFACLLVPMLALLLARRRKTACACS